MRYIALFILSVLVLSCNNSNKTNTVSKFYDDGRSRPTVAIAPVVDSTSYEVPWSLSDEFTSLVRANLSKNKNLYITDHEDIENIMSSSDNPFDPDISWIGDRFDKNEFVVFLELVKHSNTKLEKATNLDMIMRVKIVDVRGKKPRVILQENISDKYFIAKGSFKADYKTTPWGSKDFHESRMGMAHTQLANEITARINDYISLSKSR